MQQFWHVFIAYAVAWALVFGWAVATFRRIGRVEERLRDAGIGPEGEAPAPRSAGTIPGDAGSQGRTDRP